MARIRKLVRRPRIRLDTEERRAQLLALARRAFGERSYDEVSIDDLATEAKISKGLLYHYFPTKRDLYVTSLRAIASELVAAVTTREEDLPPVEQLKRGLTAYLTHISMQSRAYVSLMRGGIGSDPEVAAVIEGVRTELFQSLVSSSPFGAVLAADVKLEIAIRGWIGFVEAATLDWCVRPRLTKEQMRDLLADVLVAIVGATSPVPVALAALSR